MYTWFVPTTCAINLICMHYTYVLPYIYIYTFYIHELIYMISTAVAPIAATAVAPHTPRFTLYTAHSTLQTLHLALHTLHSTLYTLRFRLYTPHFTLYTSRLYTPHFPVYTPHPTLHTLHPPTLYTLYAF